MECCSKLTLDCLIQSRILQFLLVLPWGELSAKVPASSTKATNNSLEFLGGLTGEEGTEYNTV